MPKSTSILDLAGMLLRAQRGDPSERAKLLRQGAPLVADLVRPGTGAFIGRGLELLSEFRSFELGGSTPDADELGEGDDQTESPQNRFVRRFLARNHSFSVVAGEPGSGKTVLALRLAQRLMERGYKTLAVGGLHYDDVRKWRTEDWPIEHEHPSKFADAMRDLSEAMVEHGARYPVSISKRVLLIDDAALVAHVSATGMTRALLQAQSVSRHLSWHLILTCRSFKQIATLAENADVRFIKRPVWSSLTTERAEAREWWVDADAAYTALRHTDEWQDAPREREWVHVQSRGWSGPLHYSTPTVGDLDDSEDDD